MQNRHLFVFTLTALALSFSATQTAVAKDNIIRAGIIGCDTSHVEAFTKILPGTSAGSLVGAIVGVGGPDPTPGVIDALTGPQAIAVLAAYVVALPVVTLIVIRRRDVA